MIDRTGKEYRGLSGESYEIVGPVHKVPKGGMGDVFVAVTKGKPKTEVVIKFSKPAEGYEERLRHEAGFLRDFLKTKPEGIVTYVDESEEDAEEFFLVMEKLDGIDLDKKIGSKARDEATTIKFSIDIAQTLNYLHTCTDVNPPFLWHRDLKPDNVMVVKRNGQEHCVLIDFGAGKKGKDPGTKIHTKGYSCLHNHYYPKDVTEACDIYALGRVMFYMATGMDPSNPKYGKYSGGVPTGNMKKTLNEFDSRISEGLSNLVNDMISYPVHKIQTADQVIRELTLLSSSVSQRTKIQPRQYTAPSQVPREAHIILGGQKYLTHSLCEIGRKHNCSEEIDCSRGIIYDDMDGFEYPNTPHIEIPLSGNPPLSVADFHHIRIWKENGEWVVKDLSTTNWSAILRKGRWYRLPPLEKQTLNENFTKLAIGYSEKTGRTEIEFSFYKQ